MMLKVALPAVVNKLAGTVAVIDVAVFELTVNGVVTPENVQSTMVDVMGKLVPVSVRVNPAWLATAVDGLRPLIAGLGLMVKV